MNKVMAVGRLTKDNNVAVTKTGKKILRNTIAVRRTYKNAQGEYDSDFIPMVTMNETTINYMTNWTQKGMLVEVIGQWRSDSYDGQNGKVYTNDLNIENISSLEKKKEQPQQEQAIYEDNIQPSSPPIYTQSYAYNEPIKYKQPKINYNHPEQYQYQPTMNVTDDDLPF